MNDQQTQMMINQAPIMNQPLPPPLAPLQQVTDQSLENQRIYYYNPNNNYKSYKSVSQNFQVMSQQPQLPVQSQPLMLNRGYGNTNKQQPWPLLQQNPSKIGNFGPSKPRNSSNNSNNNWKGKKITDKRNKQMGMGAGQGSAQGYNPPALHELQSQNRQKTRKFYPNKKKFNNNNNRFAPYAPRNTTSFIIRAKKSGGIASLVSPCPVTPAVLPTPIFSPSREVLGDMAKEEWGVDGYGSMKGLIRLRSGNEHEDEDDDEANGSSESDVEEHVEVERRLDHDLSRFEMIYPNYNNGVGGDYNNVLENRVDDQDSHIAQLEEENLTLKERLFLMERELADLRRRMQFLERQNDHHQHQSCVGVEDANEGIVESGSENESENGSADARENKEENNNEDVCMEDTLPNEAKKEEVIVRSELVNDDSLAKEDDQKKIEDMDNEMGLRDESRDGQRQTVKGFEEEGVNVAAEERVRGEMSEHGEEH